MTSCPARDDVTPSAWWWDAWRTICARYENNASTAAACDRRDVSGRPGALVVGRPAGRWRCYHRRLRAAGVTAGGSASGGGTPGARPSQPTWSRWAPCGSWPCRAAWGASTACRRAGRTRAPASPPRSRWSGSPGGRQRPAVIPFCPLDYQSLFPCPTIVNPGLVAVGHRACGGYWAVPREGGRQWLAGIPGIAPGLATHTATLPVTPGR